MFHISLKNPKKNPVLGGGTGLRPIGVFMRYTILGTWTALGNPTNAMAHFWGDVSEHQYCKYCRNLGNVQAVVKIIRA